MAGNEPASTQDLKSIAAAAPADQAPRPHTNEEILAMLSAAQPSKAPAKKAMRETDRSVWQTSSFWVLWGSVFIAVAAVVYIALTAQSANMVTLALAGGVAIVVAIFLGAGALGMFSPVLLAGATLRRATGKSASEAAELAGAEILGRPWPG